jgi:hypothetical protein
MTWTHAQSTGHIFHRGVHVYSGYSGHGIGRNNPSMEAVHDVGPIPLGMYTLGTPHDSDRMGPFVMALLPVGHDALGRTGLFLHGDNDAHDASTGCIILSPREAREAIASTGESVLVVRDDDDVVV